MKFGANFVQVTTFNIKLIVFGDMSGIFLRYFVFLFASDAVGLGSVLLIVVCACMHSK